MEPAFLTVDCAEIWQALDNQRVWAVGMNAVILHSSDGGASWSNVGPESTSSNDFYFGLYFYPETPNYG